MDELSTVSFPEPHTELKPACNVDHEAAMVVMRASSPTAADTDWAVELQPPHAVAALEPGRSSMRSQSNLSCVQMVATGTDRVDIPITVAHLQGLELDGGHPLLLTAYGAYGMCADTGFEAKRLSLLERG